MVKSSSNQVLIIRVRAWYKNLVLPQRIDFVKDNLERNLQVNYLDIQPIRKLGYYLGFTFAFLLTFPKVLLDKSRLVIIENPYLMIFSPILKLRGKKILVEYVDYYPANLIRLKNQRFLRYLIAKVLCKNFQIFANIITTESITGKKTLMKWGVPAPKIRILPVGINTKTLQYSDEKRILFRSQLNIDSTDFVVGYLGKLVDYYYLDKIVESLGLWDSRPKNTKLLIIGDGPDRENLEKLSKQYKIDAIFTGNVAHDQVAGYYSSMDIFIFPLDSLAIKIAEILSIGLPLIVIRGMAEDWIKNGENGLVSESNKPEDLKLCLDHFFQMNEFDRQKLKEFQRNFAVKELSKEVITKRYFEYLNDAIM